MSDPLYDASTGRAAPLDSAPLRDYARSPGLAVKTASVPLPVLPNDARDGARAPHRGIDPSRHATFVAAVTVLLARHTRRNAVTLTLRIDGRSQVLECELPAGGRFTDLLRSMLSGLDGPGTGASPSAQDGLPRTWVTIDAADASDAVFAVEAPNADIAFQLTGCANESSARITYDTALYEAESIAPLARQLAHVLGIVASNPETPLAAIELFDAAERNRIVHGFNDLRADLPCRSTLAEQIEDHCRYTPGAVCAVHGERSLSFAELNARANRLAARLVSFGVGPGGFVAIVDHRGLGFLVAMLGIWKAGAAYIPVDPTYPDERVRYMLQDSQATVIVTGARALQRLRATLQTSTCLRNVICLEPGAMDLVEPVRVHGPESLANLPDTDSPPRAAPTDPAYMIYTSGSTGRPKGAIVRHDGALNHIHAQALALGAEHVARFLQSAPSSSDISVWQMAAPLVLGGTTAIVDDATDVEGIFEQVRRHQLHVIELVPVVLKYLTEYAATLPAAQRELPSLRWAIVTGESVSVRAVNAWLALYPGIPIVNAYGPSEAADDVAQAIIRTPLPSTRLTVPIGRPLANMDVYVLDEHLHPLPIGVPGEICVAGVGVGAGYWQQPERTRQSFVANPFDGAAGPTIYRTGDLGRLRDDGTIECLGRNDQQIQLRGHRIELQEVESVLRGHGTVAEAAAKVFHDGSGDGELVAYVVAMPGATLHVEALRAYAMGRLAPHMVPSTIAVMDRLPLNPAGKVDRQLLTRPAYPPTWRGALPARGAAAPRTATEAALLTLWQEELGPSVTGVEDDFFAIGGDSLAALAIVVAARERGLHLRTFDFVDHSTVARMASVVRLLAEPSPDAEGTAQATPAISRLSHEACESLLTGHPELEAVFPMAPSQQGIFVHWLLSRDKTAYVDQYAYVLHGALDATAFERAWNLVVQRHAALRTGFFRGPHGELVQAVHRAAPVCIEWIDHSALEVAQQTQAQKELIAKARAARLDLAKPPLIHLHLAQLSPRVHWLLWTHHHIVLDGWSMSIVLREVAQLHASIRLGLAAGLPQPAVYAHYVDELAHLNVGPAESFWRRELQGCARIPGLPTPAVPPRTRAFLEADIAFTAEQTNSLLRMARDAGITLTTVLLAAWAGVLARLTSSTEVIFGLVTSGREIAVPQIDDMVGLFVTTLPLRVNAGRHSGATPLTPWLRALHRHAATLRAHEAVPLTRIVKWGGMPAGRPLFETLFVMSNYPAPGPERDGELTIEPQTFRTLPAYPLSIIVVPGPALSVRLTHDPHSIDDALARQAAGLVQTLLTGLAQGQDPRPDAAAASHSA